MSKPALHKQSRFKQGYYKCNYPEKYIGDPGKIIYRSSWEKQFCRMCDWNPNVLKWSSESLVIPYLYEVDQKIHRYYVDFCMYVKTNSGLKKFIIEIKPLKDCKPPKNKRSKYYQRDLETYIKNKNKWESASKFADSQGWKFKVLTEKELF